MTITSRRNYFRFAMITLCCTETGKQKLLPVCVGEAPVADDDESMEVVVTGSPDLLRLVESEMSVGTLSKLFSATARAVWVVSVARVMLGCAEVTAGVCWRCVPRGMMVAMP